METNYGGWDLKIYKWEHDTYPTFQKVLILRDKQEQFLKKFARHFKVYCPTLSWTIKQGHAGHYMPAYHGPWARIAFGKETTLGTICHEFAHHLDYIRHPETKQSHGKSFKRELKKCYTFAKYLSVYEKATVEPVINVSTELSTH